MNNLPEYINGLPNICGSEKLVADAVRTGLEHSALSPGNPIDFNRIKSCCAVALHMHQPLIPAGGSELNTAKIIGNLEDMMNHQDIGDNHNAAVFHWCYKRMGEFIPQLIDEGKQPRVMLEYSGTLLHGLARCLREPSPNHARSALLWSRRMARLPLGTRRSPLDTCAGLSLECQSLAAS